MRYALSRSSASTGSLITIGTVRLISSSSLDVQAACAARRRRRADARRAAAHRGVLELAAVRLELVVERATEERGDLLRLVRHAIERCLDRRRQRATLVAVHQRCADAQHHDVVDDADAFIPVGDEVHAADEVAQGSARELAAVVVGFGRIFEDRLQGDRRPGGSSPLHALNCSMCATAASLGGDRTTAGRRRLRRSPRCNPLRRSRLPYHAFTKPCSRVVRAPRSGSRRDAVVVGAPQSTRPWPTRR